VEAERGRGEHCVCIAVRRQEALQWMTCCRVLKMYTGFSAGSFLPVTRWKAKDGGFGIPGVSKSGFDWYRSVVIWYFPDRVQACDNG